MELPVPHTLFTTPFLAMGVLFGLGTGMAAGLAPRRFAAMLGLAPVNSGGVNEIRAQYGGVFAAAGLVCAAALAGELPRESALVLLATIFGGLLAGRLASAAANRGFSGYSPTIRALHAIDTTGFVLSLAALAAERAA